MPKVTIQKAKTETLRETLVQLRGNGPPPDRLKSFIAEIEAELTKRAGKRKQ